jgi:hypothetical protein
MVSVLPRAIFLILELKAQESAWYVAHAIPVEVVSTIV